MPYATPSDVAARLGRELSEKETGLVSIRLEDAERMILRKIIPDLADKVTDGDIDGLRNSLWGPLRHALPWRAAVSI